MTGFDSKRTAALDKLTEVTEELGLYAQPTQEPVGKFAKFTDGVWREVTNGSAGIPLYITPPAPQRKPLRSYEIAQILDRERMKWNKSPPTHEFDLAFARAIEAAHGIKE